MLKIEQKTVKTDQKTPKNTFFGLFFLVPQKDRRLKKVCKH